MTVGELIKALKKFNPDLIVVYQTIEDVYEPIPFPRTFTFDTNYWSGSELKIIPKNQEHIILL